MTIGNWTASLFTGHFGIVKTGKVTHQANHTFCDMDDITYVFIVLPSSILLNMLFLFRMSQNEKRNRQKMNWKIAQTDVWTQPVPCRGVWYNNEIKDNMEFCACCMHISVYLTHWGRVTHICVGKLTIIGSDNDLSPGRRQAIIWTNAGILLIWTLGTNFSEISSEIHAFSFTKMLLKMSSAKWRPFCLGLNVLSFYLSNLLNNDILTKWIPMWNKKEWHIYFKNMMSRNGWCLNINSWCLLSVCHCV